MAGLMALTAAYKVRRKRAKRNWKITSVSRLCRSRLRVGGGAFLLILILGSAAAQFAGRAVAEAASRSGIEFASTLEGVVSGLLLFVLGIMAVSQLKIDTEIVRVVTTAILAGMALFLTFYIMAPVWNKINETALQPYLAEELSFQEAINNSAIPLRQFMFRQTREKDLALMMSLTEGERPRNPDDVPFTTIVPAFMVSEVSKAFSIGFLIYLPFLIIDMVTACVLLSMGMMMLPPVMISLPFKLLLFVLVDGWSLLIGSMVKSFQ